VRDNAESESGISAKIRNLSPMGVCLVLDRTFEPRSTLSLEMTHRWRHFSCQMPMRVVYSIRRSNGTHLVGGAFAHPLSPEEADQLLPHPTRELATEQVDDAIVAYLPAYSRLNEDAIETVDDQLAALAEESGDQSVILNLGQISGLNSAMLRQLVTLSQRFVQRGKRLALCSVAPHVSEVLDKAHLTPLFRVYPTEEAALRAS
jgi:anti-anti-sigma factor